MESTETRYWSALDPSSDTARTILMHVYQALKTKGYDPVTQLVGYITTGDPTYITSHAQARSMITRLQRDEIVEELVSVYLNKIDENLSTGKW